MITFILNNKEIQTSKKTGVTLLDFIRENKHLKGTKIGCREGDCGACTVLIGILDKDTITYKSITSCISPLGNAAGKHIVTIEGINLEKNLNKSQQLLADNFATQCGFCTPGFVVSMTGYALKNHENKNSCNDAVSGNICRCTGYKSIEKATNSLESKLNSNSNWSLESLIENEFIPAYFIDIPEKLKNIYSNKLVNDTNTIVANGTDLYVRHADSLSIENVHLIGENKSLKGIQILDNKFTIGASTTVTEILENKELNKTFPKLKSFLKLVSSEQIRNMGTLGGNFVNASPIGDMSVFFLALESKLKLTEQNSNTTREIPFSDFHQDYKKYDLQKGELITTITFKKLENNTFFNFEKVSKRTHLDIATVNSACCITITNNVIMKASISIGGVAAIPKLLEKTNHFLQGKELSIETVKNAIEILQSEITPISDIRGASEYKRLLARQLFLAHFIELFPSKIQFTKLI